MSNPRRALNWGPDSTLGMSEASVSATTHATDAEPTSPAVLTWGQQGRAFLKDEWELAGPGATPGRAHSTGKGPEAVERDSCGLSPVGGGSLECGEWQT